VAPGTGLLRLTRAAFFAVSAVGLASAAHLAAGDDVSASIALFSTPAVMIVINRLAARRRGPVSLFLSMGLTQIVLHLAFMATAIGPACAPSAMTAGTAIDGHHLTVACQPMSGHAAMVGEFWPAPSMLLAHTVAMLLLVLLLARGETAVWALAACLRFRVVLPGLVLVLPAVRQLPVPTTVARRAPKTVHLRTVRRRGPPLLAGAVH